MKYKKGDQALWRHSPETIIDIDDVIQDGYLVSYTDKDGVRQGRKFFNEDQLKPYNKPPEDLPPNE